MISCRSKLLMRALPVVAVLFLSAAHSAFAAPFGIQGIADFGGTKVIIPDISPYTVTLDGTTVVRPINAPYPGCYPSGTGCLGNSFQFSNVDNTRAHTVTFNLTNGPASGFVSVLHSVCYGNTSCHPTAGSVGIQPGGSVAVGSSVTIPAGTTGFVDIRFYPLKPPTCNLTMRNDFTGNQSWSIPVRERFGVQWEFGRGANMIKVNPAWNGKIDCGLNEAGQFDPKYTEAYSCARAHMNYGGSPYNLEIQGIWDNLYMREPGTASVTVTPYRSFDNTTGSSCTITIAGYTPLPDLQVFSNRVTLSSNANDNTIESGDAISLRALVYNSGDESVGSTKTSFCLDKDNATGTIANCDIQADLDTTSMYRGGYAAELAWSPTWTATAGMHTYRICADGTGAVTESNENNNCKIGTFTVAPLPLACGGIRVSAPASVSGPTASYDVTITNVPASVTQVLVPHWSAVKVGGTNQDDLENPWPSATKQSDGTWKYRVNLGHHRTGQPDYGRIFNHIYLKNPPVDPSQDLCGTATVVWGRSVTPPIDPGPGDGGAPDPGPGDGNLPIPGGNNDAECVSITSPDSVEAGTSFNAIVKMKNTGTKTWGTADYHLGPIDSSTSPWSSVWGPWRVNLPRGILQGEIATFQFSVRVPEVVGTYIDYGWKMLQDGVEWFGQGCTKPLTVIAADSGGGGSDQSFTIIHNPYSPSTGHPHQLRDIQVATAGMTSTVTQLTIVPTNNFSGSVTLSLSGIARDKVPSGGDGEADGEFSSNSNISARFGSINGGTITKILNSNNYITTFKIATRPGLQTGRYIARVKGISGDIEKFTDIVFVVGEGTPGYVQPL